MDEYSKWSLDAQYIFDERMGMIFGDKRLNQCHAAGVELCKALARRFEAERIAAELAEIEE